MRVAASDLNTREAEREAWSELQASLNNNKTKFNLKNDKLKRHAMSPNISKSKQDHCRECMNLHRKHQVFCKSAFN